MISADFYPTVIQFDAPSYAPTFHLTNDVRTCDANAFSTFYWLGWLAWDNFPDCWKLSEYVLTNTDLSFTIATQPQNINIGYASIYDNSQNTGSGKYPECYHESPLVNISQSYARYINKLDVMGVGNSGVLFGWHCSCIYGSGDSLTNRTYNDGTFAKSGKSLYDFLYGDATQIIQLTTGISYELDFNNINEDGSFHFTTTYNDNNYDFVISFSYCAVLNMQNVSSTSVASTRNVNAYPMYSLTMDDDVYSFINTGSCFYQPAGYPACIINKQTQQPFDTPSAGNIIGDYIANGLACDIPKAFITSSPTYSRLITGNAHVFNRGSDIAVYRMLTRSEMQKIVGLSLRQSDGTYNTYGYQNELSYAPYITADNEFTATLITGDLSDNEFKAKLRPWQYDVDEWAENDYTEEDLPPYEGEDTEDEESGQSIPIQRRLSTGAVSSFITCYGLTATQVQEFGKKLWSSWVDNGGLVMAMVENFKFLIDSGIASNTGSIDISSVLDFVVSLKVYPCDLRNLYAFSNNDSDGKIYIGRGTYGLEVSNSAIYKAINQIGYLDAGTYNVPRPFGDFRDYTNINITVYVPYCGTIELNPADVIGRTLSGTYVVDVMTGECTFFLEVYAVTDSGEHRYIVGTCDGQLGVTIPVSATNSGQIAARRFSDVAQFATTVGGFFNRNMQIGNDIAMQMATLGASGIASKNPEMASAREQNIKMTGSQAYADNALGLLKDVTGQFGNSLTRAAIDAPNISGGSGIASFANPDCVWIQIRHGIYPTVNNYNHTVGKVSTKSAPLSSYSGFTVCHNVDVSSLSCTEEEKSAIKQLLETGVYL